MAAADPIAASPVYPAGSRVNERGHLEIAGCDVVELAERFGTPAYIYAEDDIRRRAEEYMRAFEERTDAFEVIYASKALPCTAAYRLMREAGLSVDVASGGELHMALAAGFDPARIHMHGNNKTERELRYAFESGVGHLILDSFDEIELADRLLDRPQRVLIRVTPGIKPSTHDYVQTGPARLEVRLRPRRPARRAGGRAGARIGEPRAGRAARPHRLADLRARAVREGDRGDRGLLRVGRPRPRAAQRRRRPRDRLPGHRRAALDRGLRRGQGPRRAARLRPGAEDPGRAGPLAGRQRRA